MSGAGTNAGINYQNRVASSFLTIMLADIEVGVFLNWSNFNNRKIVSIALEGSSQIDDLIINLDNHEKIYAQIKRNVSLSNLETSDFIKTMDQFMRAYLSNQNNDKYILITPTFSSSKITRDLKKILDSIRLDSNNFQNNPLSKSEQETYKIFKQVIGDLYKKYTKVNLTKTDFINFARKTFISQFDIENNSPTECAILSLLSSIITTRISPSLFWEQLISKCLSYASNRQSIDKDYLLNSYASYFMKHSNNQINIQNEKFLQFIFEQPLLSGKEYVLVENNGVFDTDYLLLELNRFNEDCEKQIEFDDKTCTLLRSNMSFNILYRASTATRILQLLSKNKSILQDKTLSIIPANGLEDIELTNCSTNYSQMSASRLKQKNDLLHCLACSKSISSDQSFVVEIDQIDLPNDIGLIHCECLQPSFRILGEITSHLFMEYKTLKNFNWNIWFKQILKGQLLFKDTVVSTSKQQKTMLWNSECDYLNTYDYCIKEEIEDGSYDYVTMRGKIEKFNKSQAQDAAKRFNQQLIELKDNNDYMCIIKSSRASSTYSYLKDRIGIEDELLEIKKYVIEKINPLILSTYDENINFYAPLFYIVQGEDQEYFTIQDRVVFLSDPLLFNKYIQNWNKIDIEIQEKYEINIVEDDIAFDNIMHKIYRQGMKAIFNPYFDQNHNLLDGIKIERYCDYTE